MADDAEDVEQIYLTANRDSLGAGSTQPKYPLRDIIDGVNFLLKDGQIRAAFCNDPNLPSQVPGGLMHHYWFSPTDKGEHTWATFSTLDSQK
jgi:hypothetical protein